MVCLIGNSGTTENLKDGQTSKVRLYLKKIKDEGYEVNFIDLENFTKHPFSTLIKIKKAIKSCERIVLITAKKGCRVLIPYINFFNKRLKKPFVLPLVGTSFLHFSIDKLSVEEKNRFLLKSDYSLSKRPIIFSKQLSKITYIFPETDLLTKTFKNFYHLNNVITLTNFREGFGNSGLTIVNNDNILRLVYLSRIMSEKGIFDLIQAVSDINDNKKHITLDIYGDEFLKQDESKLFNSYLDDSIIFRGHIDFNEVVNTISKYDVFVFPTRFVGEGVPGVIVESLLANTPILTSDFPQVYSILKNGYDSVFYKMFDKEDLKNKLLYLLKNKKQIIRLKEGVKETAKKYTYKHERSTFLKYICGKDVNER